MNPSPEIKKVDEANITTGLSFGANLGNAPDAVERAIAAVAALPRTHLKRRSSLYRTEPWGGVPQDWYTATRDCSLYFIKTFSSTIRVVATTPDRSCK